MAPEDAEAILGQRVIGPTGKEIGRLVDVLVDANGQPQAAVIDFGGFMGVGNRKIAVHWSVASLQSRRREAQDHAGNDARPDQGGAGIPNPNKAVSVVTPTDIRLATARR